jgi:tyrosinase
MEVIMAEIRKRRDAWKLKVWDDTLLWYAKAVGELQKRPINQPLSWRYQAAIHDYVAGQDPLAQPREKLPAKADQKRFWAQCQHFSWYFLPWHRMYLFYFEQIIAATIVELKGPKGWCLPYWNYSDSNNPDARRLPLAFRTKTLPDKKTANPLFVAERDAGNNGEIVADDSDVNLRCLRESIYTAAQSGGDPGFGGSKTLFNHARGAVGSLEATPHGSMHVAVGGFMGSFNTAGLDPVFWLHHANIDRLWNVWRKRNAQNVNPTDPQWLTGVTFEFHDASTPTPKRVTFTASQVDDSTVAPLEYEYEDESDPLPSAAVHLAMRPPEVEKSSIPEMVGATAESLTLTGTPAQTRMSLRPPAGPAREAALTAAPRRIFLNIENITGTGKARGYSVYVNVPEGADPAAHPELHAGDLPMFGVAEASRADETHPGNGLHYSLDITDVVRNLEAKGQWDAADVRVSFVPKRAPQGSARALAGPAKDHEIHVGRVSVYYA